ncbi:MAG: NERD domain-containing protein [Acholeplasmataceae bacterium]|nr:MAG: NERD domain-containing protein [Acholeplasmataceae bacterium]
MKKQRVFSFLEGYLIFIALIFIYGGFVSLQTSFEVSIIMFSISTFQLVYIWRSITLKITVNQQFKKTIETEQEVEDKLDKEKSKVYQEVKQMFLEKLLEKELTQNYPEAKIFRNVRCPRHDGSSTQIDLIMLDESGIYVFEAKNLSAKISGNWAEDNMTLYYESGQTFEKYYNPIKQNENHIKALSSILGVNIDEFINIVVLGEKTFYENRDNVPLNTSITKIKNLHKTIKFHKNRSKVELSQNRIGTIQELLDKHMIEPAAE